MALTPNTRLGPYEIVSPLGAGGMGEVYRAKDTRLDREVAIKVLPERTVRDERALARFQRETKALAALSHPNILMILDVGEHQGVSYAVMELLEGETLRQRMKHSGVDGHKALEIGAAIADGLAAAHSHGVVHRDLKPENLFLTRDGVVKILDFGLARTGLPSEPSAATITVTTQPGVVLGTVNYMSPEQVRAENTDARSDIFSLGCVLYEMLTGDPPFVHETGAETMTAVLRHHPPPVSQTGARVSASIDPIVGRCLEKRPEDRFQSARDLAFTLRTVLSGSGTPATPAAGGRYRRVAVPALVSVVGGALALSSFLFWRALQSSVVAPRGPIRSLAVLPLENLSGDPDQEYFADAMTDAIIDDLAKISALRVTSRTTAMQYKKSPLTLPQIARELGVDGIVEGSAIRVGDRVQVKARLIEGSTEKQLWADRYDRELRDILSLQGEVARSIADGIQAKLTPTEELLFTRAKPVIPEAYTLYAQGMSFVRVGTKEACQTALIFFDRSIELDPAFALAHVGRAEAYRALANNHLPPRETFPQAEAAAKKALELEPNLAEAHAFLGDYRLEYEWNWAGAELAYKRALELHPSLTEARLGYASYLVAMKRSDEAMDQLDIVQELDPAAPYTNDKHGLISYMARRFERTVRDCRAALEVDPKYWAAHQNLGLALAQLGQFAESIDHLRQASKLDRGLGVQAMLGGVLATAGHHDEAKAILAELKKREERDYVCPYELATIPIALAEYDEAFAEMDRACEARADCLAWLQVDPRLDPIRHDLRFDRLLRRVGFEPQGVTLKLAEAKDEKIMLAVLPFENLSRDPEQEYFSDGMTEELISQLGRINAQRLEVIARTSAMRFKKTDKDVAQIGRELKVDYVVEGSVRRADGRVRITAQLVHVVRQTHLWSEAFDRDLKDILALQSDVAQAVARQINVKLNPQEEARLAAIRPVNPAAHEAYMRGRFLWHTRTPAGMQNSIESFRRAIELDPGYAPAHAGLADAHSQLARHGHVSPKEAFSLAKQAALRAVELDPGSAEAHGALAVIALYFDWQWTVAERETQRALDLNPSYEEAHHQYSHLLQTQGRPDESLTESRRALELNPLDRLLNVHLGWHYMMTRQDEQAIAQYKSVLEMDPNHYQALRHIGWAYMYKSLHAEAIVALEAANKLEAENSQAMSALGAAYAAGGRGSDARAILGQLEGSLPQRYVSACDIAAVYAALDEPDVALDWLEKAFEERSPRMVELGLDPVFDPLRSDPRFAELVRRMGLPR